MTGQTWTDKPAFHKYGGKHRRFSIECRKTTKKVVTLTNRNSVTA